MDDSQMYVGKTAITFGVFDLLHFGHFELFRRIRDLVGASGRVYVMLQRDEMVKKYKPGSKHVYDFQTRKSMIETLRTVTAVYPYDISSPEAVAGVDFDVLVLGPDQTAERFVNFANWCRRNGKTVRILPRTEGISSSMLRANRESEK